MSSEQTIVLITGANRGIGYETAKNLLLHSANYHAILASRSLSRVASAASDLQYLRQSQVLNYAITYSPFFNRSTPGILGTITPLQLDVTSDASINAAVAFIQTTYSYIDTLVLNAGIFGLHPRSAMPSTLRSNFTKILSINVISSLVLTETFLPLLTASKSLSPRRTPRIIFVSSSVGSISQAADPNSRYHHPGANEYRASKAALNIGWYSIGCG